MDDMELLRGLLAADVTHLEPLPGEVVEKALRPLIGEHPMDLLAQNLSIFQLPALGDLEELVGMRGLVSSEWDGVPAL